MTGGWQKVLIGLAIAFVAGLFLLGLVVGAAVHGWQAAKRAGNETATIQNMRTIGALEAQYFSLHNRTFATFDQLMAEKMVSSKFEGTPPIADGYILTLSLTSKPMGSGASYTLAADPVDDDYGEKHFYLDSTSLVLHVNPHNQAGPNDPLIPDR